MSHPFEQLPTTPRSEELLDKAFSRASRSGRAKRGTDAQQSMLLTAANIVSDNLQNVVGDWPDFDRLDPFYYELADAIVGADDLRQHLNELSWAANKTTEIRYEYEPRLSGDLETARKFRKQAFARIADVVEEIEDDLLAVADAREKLRDLPDIRPDEPTIVVAGSPNVGKSSFVNDVTRATNEEAAYPFTTTEIQIGHVEANHIKYQIVDTPGLLDRPAEQRNPSESQAVSALEHAADAVLVVLDPSGDSGYPLETQLQLRADILERFDVPVVTVANKRDRFEGDAPAEADSVMSLETGENVQHVLDAVIEAVGYEPELPIDDER
ncbi:NOG1 family protein [Halovenus halobia]|uniref:NOG1 family protein n=1 Tax=Halovenus halobia TaxID=3396622 RepID=UPI003F56388B